MKYDFKKKGHEKNSETLQQERRVTYDFNGVPIVRLVEKRDFLGKQENNPVKEYWKIKKENEKFFTKLNRAQSVKDKFTVTQSYINMRPNTLKPFEAAGVCKKGDSSTISSHIYKSVFTLNNEITQEE